MFFNFIDINFAFSRNPNQPKRYVQDVMRERASDLAKLFPLNNTYIYVCGLKDMEHGVMDALKDIISQANLSWESVASSLKLEGRLHLETY